MSRQPQTESSYVLTVRDGDCLCPDLPRQKVHMSNLSCVQKFEFFVPSKTIMFRSSQTKSVYVHIFVRSCPDHRALQKFVRSNAKVLVHSCPVFRAFTSRQSCVHQIFVLSCLEFCPFISRLSCFQTV